MSEDKYNLLLDIFENRQLKQAMEYVDSQIILSTVHGAKGLEWDYVVLADILREYDLYPSTLDKWIKQYETTQSFLEADNRTPEQKRLLLLEKENARLQMENDLLKQAALILGRK